MNTFLTSFGNQLKAFYQTQTPVKRISMIMVAFIIAGSVIIISLMISGRSFVPLFTNIPAEQLPTIINKLKEKNVMFEVRDDGKTVAVPPELLHSLQMSIMTEAQTNKMGAIGFELFDKQSFGITSYAQKINYQRAMQGELMRSINTLEVVRNSKVILAIPPKKTFLEEGGVVTASVVVDLHDGKNLSAEQVKGIQYLVASAVENLDSEKVTVVDSRGKVLSKNRGDSSAALSNDLIDLKQKTEAQLEERIESILERVVGSGKVMARVDATLNTQAMSAVEEEYDADKIATRSVQSEEEAAIGARTSPVGVPGARANLPGAQDAGQVGFNQDVKKNLVTTNYEVPKTVKNIRENPGRLTRLSVAVVMDGTREVTTKEDGTTQETWKPRSAEEIQKYTALVKNAIGFNEGRDSVTVENIKFETENFGESDQILSQLERRKLLNYLVRWSVIGLALFLFFFLVVRPFMRWVTESFQESIDDMLPKTIEELEEIQSLDGGGLPGMSSALPILEESLDPDKAESELLKEKILSLVENNGRKSSNALSLWLVKKE